MSNAKALPRQCQTQRRYHGKVGFETAPMFICTVCFLPQLFARAGSSPVGAFLAASRQSDDPFENRSKIENFCFQPLGRGFDPYQVPFSSQPLFRSYSAKHALFRGIGKTLFQGDLK